MDGVLIIIAVTVGLTVVVGKKKGYPILLMGLLGFVFPIMSVIVFFLPDRNEMKRNAEETQYYNSIRAASRESAPRIEDLSTGEAYRLGVDYFNRKYYESALLCCTAAAEQGHFESQLLCAIINDRGLCGTQDPRQALYWAKKAADHEDYSAIRYFNVLYNEQMMLERGEVPNSMLKAIAQDMALVTALEE